METFPKSVYNSESAENLKNPICVPGVNLSFDPCVADSISCVKRSNVSTQHFDKNTVT